MKAKTTMLIAGLACQACARNWVNYPPQVIPGGLGPDGRYREGRVIAARAAEFNGSDLIGNTIIDVTRNGTHIAVAGGINNSISTAEGYRSLRYGIGAAATVAGVAVAANAAQAAYSSNQAATATSNAAASRAAAAAAAAKSNEAITIQAIKAGAPLLPR